MEKDLSAEAFSKTWGGKIATWTEYIILGSAMSAVLSTVMFFLLRTLGYELIPGKSLIFYTVIGVILGAFLSILALTSSSQVANSFFLYKIFPPDTRKIEECRNEKIKGLQTSIKTKERELIHLNERLKELENK